MMSEQNTKNTRLTRQRYNRMGPIYDAMEILVETTRFRPWRKALWQKVKGPRILEIGVGTGKNMPYYPANMNITAIDLSPGMLKQAKKRAKRLSSTVQLLEGDAQALPFEDHSFETVIATFVFCSVPDPVLGFKEARRVLVPNGQLILIEHVLSECPLYRWAMNLLNPLVVRMSGANINRETVKNVIKSGFPEPEVETLLGDIIFQIQAYKLNGPHS